MSDDSMHFDEKNKEVVFILSEARSGSTWLSYVLGSHTGAVHLGEYYRPFTFPESGCCRLCEAKGRTECEFLYGIEKIPKQYAFDFAFERFQKQFLIDCSKQLEWLKIFVGSQSFSIRVVHLLRDPRAWFASEKRRLRDLSVEEAMSRWTNTNHTIEAAIEELSIPGFVAFYDELCINPDLYFNAGLSDFLGIPFEKDAIEYWRFEHHGLGGNGAAYNNLMNYAGARVFTADDAFYQKMHKKRFYDDRWIEEINQVERKRIETTGPVVQYLERKARSFDLLDSLYESSKRG